MSLPQPSTSDVLAPDELARFRSEVEDMLRAHESRIVESDDTDDISLAIRNRSEQARAEIQAALARMIDGSFGRCEGCGNAIGVDRLEAVPYTRFCKSCASVEAGPGIRKH